MTKAQALKKLETAIVKCEDVLTDANYGDPSVERAINAIRDAYSRNLYITQFAGPHDERIILWRNKPNTADINEYAEIDCPLKQIVECKVLSGNLYDLPANRALIAE